MYLLQSTRSKFFAAGLGSALLGFFIAWPVLGLAQDNPKSTSDPQHVHPTDKPSDPNREMLDQIKLLQVKVARLEAAVAKIAPPAGGMSGGGMGGMMGMDGMMMGGMGGGGMGGMKGSGMGMTGMDGMMMGGMSGMSGGSGGGMSDMDMMGMGAMGGSKGMKMKMTAALPGFPGASHIYHIGATDFFLDHPEHITLSTEQKTKLGQLKQKATTDKASTQRKVEEAEQQLWELTAADQPDAGKIDAKVREIEKLRGDQRMTFIRAVGEAAQVITDDQRKILLGLAKPAGDTSHTHPGGESPGK
jgi:Spy/CpxP family protein refolding chaperone